MRDRDGNEGMEDVYREDPAYAVALLKAILKNGDQGELLIILRQMTKALGGIKTSVEESVRLEKFHEETLKSFDKILDEVRESNKDLSQEEVIILVDEALNFARKNYSEIA
jgi:DNA-binding phage protein